MSKCGKEGCTNRDRKDGFCDFHQGDDGFDPVSKPAHYNSHPSGVECIQITEHMDFLLGNAMKYIWRADLKGGIEDLKKAEWYIKREIEKRERKEKQKNT